MGVQFDDAISLSRDGVLFKETALAFASTRKQDTKTADYPVATDDHGKTLILNTPLGASAATVTFGEVVLFSSTFFVLLTNVSARCWKMAGIAGSPILLWPNQSALVQRVGANWYCDTPGRFRCREPLKIYVDTNPGAGSDDNDGLTTTSGGSLATVNEAIKRYSFHVDCAGQPPGIIVANGIVTESVVHTFGLTGYHALYLAGSGAYDDLIVRTGAVGITSQVRDNSILLLDKMKFEASGAGAIAVESAQAAVVDFGNVEFGAFSGGYHFRALPGGYGGYTGGANVKVTGSAIAHYLGLGGSMRLESATVDVAAGLTFSTFAYARANSHISAFNMTFTGSTPGGLSSYRDSTGSFRCQTVSYFPGSGDAAAGNSAGAYETA